MAWDKPWIVSVNHPVSGRVITMRQYIYAKNARKRYKALAKVYPNHTISLWFVNPEGEWENKAWRMAHDGRH